MTTYTITFHTPQLYAVERIKAKTPGQALTKAHAAYDNDPHTLNWIRDDRDAQQLESVIVHGDDDDPLAIWHSEHTRVRLAARDLLDALELCEDALSQLARIDDGTPSISALMLARAAIAKAKTPAG